MKVRPIAIVLAVSFITCSMQAPAKAQSLRDRVQQRPSARTANQTTNGRSADTRSPSQPGRRGSGIVRPFRSGTTCLFAGHSFFAPVARTFDGLAKRGDFPEHRAELIFSPGVGGSPSGLWNDTQRRNQIAAKLAKGNVSLFGMPAPSSRSDSPVQDLKNWVDLALKHNPNTTFLIGQPWPAGGPRLTESKYTRASQAATRTNFDAVEKLRRAYPNNRFIFIDYGKLATEMKSQFAAGRLPDIKESVGRGPDSLFRDYFMGHAGPLMTELSAVVWLNLIYAAEVREVINTSVSPQAMAIVETSIKHNKQFR
ncbi:MAG: hypothetical protein AAGG48_11075 [Planctomycetota bacterium]